MTGAHPKEIIKAGLRLLLPSSVSPVLVASMGRVGSSLVYRSICHGMARTRFGSFGSAMFAVAAGGFVDDFGAQKLLRGVVYKTHALPSELSVDEDLRVVFVFGTPSVAAQSVYACRERYGEDWVAQHFSHMRANGDFDELLDADVLRMEEQIEEWLSQEDLSVLGLRYDALWQNVDALSEFVGFRVDLPPRRARKSASIVGTEVASRLRRTYGSLDRRVDRLPNVVLTPLASSEWSPTCRLD